MFKQLIPLSSKLHQNKKLKNIKGFGFASNFHVASIMTHEFIRAAAIYPIVFIEDKEKDRFLPVAMLGLKANQNLFVDKEGKWQASYIPAIIRRYPFALAKTNQEDQYTICIDENSEIVNEKEGVALFNEDGSAADVLENVKRYLGELHQMEAITHDFCRFMAENNLFAPMNMRVRDSDKVQNIAGCYVINDERLNNLSDERFLELRKKRFLPVVYAHLTSLAQIERLMRLAGKLQPVQSQGAVERMSEKEETEDVLH
ncbi:peptidase [Desulfosarcina ovata subsp. sediminis]|uniref:Peptidase n=1 Tax=Desulfosarcina ovata subsp. sediminis TaxID=885957 RepID=A0A5K7ZRU9_9BACT|nr:SapC family protein [Desulfosarcina ovata]BBO82883.1 peptidase [Desulfosarcina ovata subsp. sediminis]